MKKVFHSIDEIMKEFFPKAEYEVMVLDKEEADLIKKRREFPKKW